MVVVGPSVPFSHGAESSQHTEFLPKEKYVRRDSPKEREGTSTEDSPPPEEREMDMWENAMGNQNTEERGRQLGKKCHAGSLLLLLPRSTLNAGIERIAPAYVCVSESDFLPLLMKSPPFFIWDSLDRETEIFTLFRGRRIRQNSSALSVCRVRYLEFVSVWKFGGGGGSMLLLPGVGKSPLENLSLSHTHDAARTCEKYPPPCGDVTIITGGLKLKGRR